MGGVVNPLYDLEPAHLQLYFTKALFIVLFFKFKVFNDESA